MQISKSYLCAYCRNPIDYDAVCSIGLDVDLHQYLDVLLQGSSRVPDEDIIRLIPKEKLLKESKRLKELVCLGVRSGRLSLVKYLLSVRSFIGEAFSQAACSGKLEIMQYLFGEAVAKGRKAKLELDSALVNSAANGHLEVVQFLVESCKVKCDGKCLKYTAEHGHLPVVRYLVEHGADFRDDDDYAVKWAASFGHLEVVKYLVGLGADFRAENDLGITFGNGSIPA